MMIGVMRYFQLDPLLEILAIADLPHAASNYSFMYNFKISCIFQKQLIPEI